MEKARIMGEFENLLDAYLRDGGHPITKDMTIIVARGEPVRVAGILADIGAFIVRSGTLNFTCKEQPDGTVTLSAVNG